MSHHFILSGIHAPCRSGWAGSSGSTSPEGPETSLRYPHISGGHATTSGGAARAPSKKSTTTSAREAIVRNTNCLEGLACPKCGNDERLFIVGMSVFEVVDDGTVEHEDVEWDDSSHTRCPQCNFVGNLCEFREEVTA